MSRPHVLDDAELEQITGGGKLPGRDVGLLPPTYPGRGPQPEAQDCNDDDRICDQPAVSGLMD